MSRYASVYPLVTARAVARAYTYEVPDETAKGAVVEVKFGNARRRGVVTELDVALPSTGVADEMLTRAVELGYERRDIAALFQVLARTNDAPR